MQPDDAIRLRHMMDAARRAMGFLEHRSRGELEGDCQLGGALVEAVEIIGEAAFQMAPHGT